MISKYVKAAFFKSLSIKKKNEQNQMFWYNLTKLHFIDTGTPFGKKRQQMVHVPTWMHLKTIMLKETRHKVSYMILFV